MKYWFGHPFYECECGFTSLDKEAFEQHIARKGHKVKGAVEVKKKVVHQEPSPVYQKAKEEE